MPSTRTHYFFVQTPIRVRVLLFIKKEAIAFATNREHINLKSGGWLKRKTFKCEALKKPKIRQRGSFYLKKRGCYAKIQSRGTRALFRHSITRRHQLQVLIKSGWLLQNGRCISFLTKQLLCNCCNSVKILKRKAQACKLVTFTALTRLQ